MDQRDHATGRATVPIEINLKKSKPKDWFFFSLFLHCIRSFLVTEGFSMVKKSHE